MESAAGDVYMQEDTACRSPSSSCDIQDALTWQHQTKQPCRPLLHGQLDCRRRRLYQSNIEQKLLGKYCTTLRETNLSALLHNKADKIFAVAWMDHDTVMWGTKCNKLFTHNLRTRQVVQVPLPPVPAEFTRLRPKIMENNYGRCGIHAISFNPSRTLLATGGEDPNDVMLLDFPSLKPLKIYMGHQDWVFGLRWLSDQHLVSGGRDGRLMLWNINTSREGLCTDVRPTRSRILQKNHRVRDLSYCYLTKELVALDPSGCVRLWDPVAWKLVKSWDTEDNDELICMHSREHLVTAGTLSNLVVLDTRMPGQAHSSGSAAPAPPPAQVQLHRHPDKEGLRSVRFNGTIISCGGSYGSLSFYDVVAGKWVCEDSTDCSSSSPLNSLSGSNSSNGSAHWRAVRSSRGSSGRGHNSMGMGDDEPGSADMEGGEEEQQPLQQHDEDEDDVTAAAPVALQMSHIPWDASNLDEQQRQYFDEEDAPAMYCQEWDESGKRLIAGGGPLSFGVKGIYAGLWT